VDAFVERLEELARLGRETREFEQLIGKHELRALARLLEKVESVMDLIDGPITTREGWVGEGPTDGPPRAFYYKEPGIALVNSFASQVGDDHEMNYSGFKVVFTRSGKLVQLDRIGQWNEGEQKDTFWSSDAHEIELDPTFASNHLEECVASIVSAIERGAKRHSERRDELIQRLRVLKKVTRMLEGDEAALKE
jgi:hypothetical protein